MDLMNLLCIAGVKKSPYGRVRATGAIVVTGCLGKSSAAIETVVLWARIA
jgi:hypothetical protein